MSSGEEGPLRRASQNSVLRQSSRFVKGTSVYKPSNVDGSGLAAILLHWMNLLLVFFPLGMLAVHEEWGDTPVFWFMFVAMIPMAKILGDATEELAAGLKNDMLAGLLNATFGNAVEMVITVQTLRRGLYDVVKATLLGSVLSNMLLVLGMSFFFGGIVNNIPATKLRKTATKDSLGTTSSDVEYSRFATGKVQHFRVLGAMVNTSMLLLSCLSFSLVTVFRSVTTVDGLSYGTDDTLLPVSRTCSLIIASAYVAYIIFQLVTHREAMADEEGEGGEEEPVLSIGAATALLFGTTLFVAFASEYLVRAIEGVTKRCHLSQHFIGIILLPIVGNACEHMAAVRFAMMDKPSLSIGIAVGSSTQIALFVVPFSVIVGWAIEKDMDLNFGALNTTVMTLSVVVVLSMVVDGQSNWLQGYLLCAAYAVIAVLYGYLPNDLENIS